jgi:hypothetical protein
MHFPAGAGKCKKPPGGGRLAHASLGVQMLQGDGGPSKALDQGALDGAQPIGATEITFDIGDKAIECLRRASATVELAARKQLPRVALCERRRAGFARLSGWQPVGNWVASAGEFSSIPVTRQRSPPIGHSLRPGHYRNARLVPLRDGSLTLTSFFELNLSKK